MSFARPQARGGKRLLRSDSRDHLLQVDARRPRSFERWLRAYQLGCDGPRTYPVVRLTESGIVWGAHPGPGDEIGYCMDPWRTDDCLQAAIATVLQVPIQQVPCLELEEKSREPGADLDAISQEAWARITTWATKRLLRLTFHDRVPVARERWIGVCGAPSRQTYHLEPDRLGRPVPVPDTQEGLNDHCLVMCHDRLVFDPACSVNPPPGFAVARYNPSMIDYGITFDTEEDQWE